MNVLLAVTNLKYANGGVCTHVMDLCVGLLKRGNKVVLTVDDSDGNDYMRKIKQIKQDYSNYFIYVSIPYYDIQKSIKGFYYVFKQVASVVKEEKIDIIHSHGQGICLVGILLNCIYKIPLVWTNHIDEVAKQRVFKWILRLSRFHVISVSTDLKKYLINTFGIKENRITVINNGIDVSKFHPMTFDERKRVRAKYAIKDEYVISLLARITFVKGHNFLLEAVKNLLQYYPNAKIKVLFAGKVYEGEKNYLQKQVEYANEHNIDLQYLGFQSPRDIFGISDMSVLPSIYEGFGLTCLESLAMECPVIRANTPGWSDIKDLCLVFNKADIQDFSEKLIYAFDNKEMMQKIGHSGRTEVINRFSIDNMIEKTMEVYINNISKK